MAYATSQGFWNAFAPDKSGGQTKCTVNNGPLNVRSQPQGDVVETLAQGATLAISNNKQNGWVELNAPTKGWVYEQYIDCGVKATVAKTQATPTPEETQANPTPKETKATPTPTESPSPKESPDKIKSAIENTKRLAGAAQKYQQGNLDGAIADVESILAENPSFKEAQTQIDNWKKAKAQFDKVQTAYNEGRYVDVLRDASGVNFPGNPYLEEKLNQLVQEATKRKNETEGNQTEKREEGQPDKQTQETPSDNSTPEPDKSP
jgi:serine/threonine-protein kinase